MNLSIDNVHNLNKICELRRVIFSCIAVIDASHFSEKVKNLNSAVLFLKCSGK